MVPYAGVSFLTYGTLKKKVPALLPYFAERRTARDLFCGAIAGAVSQTASYPFEVTRRRMQVGGVGGGAGISWRDAVKTIHTEGGWRGFFVGLSIGYVKVIPMTRYVQSIRTFKKADFTNSISFATWQLMKRVFEL